LESLSRALLSYFRAFLVHLAPNSEALHFEIGMLYPGGIAMFLQEQFPHLWFNIHGTFSRLSLLLAMKSESEEPPIEADRMRQQLSTEIEEINPFAKHFCASFASKSRIAGATKSLGARVDALSNLRSSVAPGLLAAHTQWDLNNVQDIQPDRNDLAYIAILIERLQLALVKAQAANAVEIGLAIQAVKEVLEGYVGRFENMSTFDAAELSDRIRDHLI
jgi:hypothetical protein